MRRSAVVALPYRGNASCDDGQNLGQLVSAHPLLRKHLRQLALCNDNGVFGDGYERNCTISKNRHLVAPFFREGLKKVDRRTAVWNSGEWQALLSDLWSRSRQKHPDYVQVECRADPSGVGNHEFAASIGASLRPAVDHLQGKLRICNLNLVNEGFGLVVP